MALSVLTLGFRPALKLNWCLLVLLVMVSTGCGDSASPRYIEGSRPTHCPSAGYRSVKLERFLKDVNDPSVYAPFDAGRYSPVPVMKLVRRSRRSRRSRRFC